MTSTVFGIIYLALGLTLTTTIVSRLYEYWEGFVMAQKVLLGGVMVMMFAYTIRGVELLWFDAPGPRPAGYVSVVGACMALYALISPVDKRLDPPSWKSALKEQEPENFDKYMDILNKSAANRNISSRNPERYKTTYDES